MTRSQSLVQFRQVGLPQGDGGLELGEQSGQLHPLSSPPKLPPFHPFQAGGTGGLPREERPSVGKPRKVKVAALRRISKGTDQGRQIGFAFW